MSFPCAQVQGALDLRMGQWAVWAVDDKMGGAIDNLLLCYLNMLMPAIFVANTAAHHLSETDFINIQFSKYV